ncbi:hypothetical protein SASPL_154054 [Salvia splendens]|uniref:PGG domain-containing protein n=1 Tax=Salvia splendens TaxID=180675 RepID=A0A8X8YYB6_SALSN|nr:hypothetical protein SASPL_154054 [Salvia splendens]
MGSTAMEILDESRDSGFTKNVKSKISSGFMSQPKMLKFPSKRRELTMVVMTLIATMAYSEPPWQEDTSSHRAGEAVIATTHPKIYKHLIRANTIAFVSSLITIFLAAVPQRLGDGFLLIFSHYIVCVSLAAIAVSFGGSLMVIAPDTQAQSLTLIIIIVVVVTVSFLGITLLWEAFKYWNRGPNTFEFCVEDILGWQCSKVILASSDSPKSHGVHFHSIELA